MFQFGWVWANTKLTPQANTLHCWLATVQLKCVHTSFVFTQPPFKAVVDFKLLFVCSNCLKPRRVFYLKQSFNRKVQVSVSVPRDLLATSIIYRWHSAVKQGNIHCRADSVTNACTHSNGDRPGSSSAHTAGDSSQPCVHTLHGLNCLLKTCSVTFC